MHALFLTMSTKHGLYICNIPDRLNSGNWGVRCCNPKCLLHISDWAKVSRFKPGSKHWAENVWSGCVRPNEYTQFESNNILLCKAAGVYSRAEIEAVQNVKLVCTHSWDQKWSCLFEHIRSNFCLDCTFDLTHYYHTYSQIQYMYEMTLKIHDIRLW